MARISRVVGPPVTNVIVKFSATDELGAAVLVCTRLRRFLGLMTSWVMCCRAHGGSKRSQTFCLNASCWEVKVVSSIESTKLVTAI